MSISIILVLVCSASALRIRDPTPAQLAAQERESDAAQEVEGTDISQSDAEFMGFHHDMAFAKSELLHQSKHIQWHKVAKRKAEEVKALQKVSVLMYGDSLVEQFSGAMAGVQCGRDAGGCDNSRIAGATQVWKEEFLERYGKCHASGIQGDAVGNLLWRLQHGEGPQNAQPRAIVLAIGTNDFHWGDGSSVVEETANGYKKIIQELRQASPTSDIILSAVLPRAKPSIFEGRYKKMIPEFNKKIAEFADNSKIHFVDCGSSMLGADGEINKNMLPDEIHPGYDGAKAWAKCLQPALDQILLQ